MAGRKGSHGRPWAQLRGESEEINAIATLIRGQLEGGGITFSRLRERLMRRPELLDGRTVPSSATLSKRFAGVGLANEGWLVEAVIDLCAPAEDLDLLKERVRELQAAHRAREQRATRHETHSGPAEEPEPGLRQQLHQSQALVALLMGMLAGGKRSPSPDTAGRLGRRVEALESEVRLLREEMAPRGGVSFYTRAPMNSDRDGRPVRSVPSPRRPIDEKDLLTVDRALRSLDPDGSRLAACVRRVFDQVLDGSRTGRFRLDQLNRSERMRIQLQLETEVQREFGFPPNPNVTGDDGADFFIDGVPIDFKFTVGKRAPRRASRFALVLSVSASDDVGMWSAMLWGPPHAPVIHTLFENAPLPDNVLLRLPSTDLEAVFERGTPRHRIAELMRRATGRVVSQSVLRTVAMSSLAPRWLRESAAPLAEEGILVLAESDGDVAEALGLPLPGRREYVSVRLARVGPWHADDAPAVELDGERWTVAGPDDPVEPVDGLRDPLRLIRGTY